MSKILFNKKFFRPLFITGVLCGILLACLHVTPGIEMSLEDAYLYARDGYIELSYREYSADVMYCLLNILLFIPFASQIFNSDYETAKAFVFIRIKSISQWYKYKVIQSMVYCFFYSFIYNITLVVMIAIMGFKANNPLLVIEYLIFGILTGFLILSVIIMANNVLCIKIKPHFSTALIMGLTAFGMVVTLYLNDWQIQFSLLSNYFISWHMVMNENSEFYYYPTWVYYSVIFIVIIIETLIGNRIMKKTDHI